MATRQLELVLDGDVQLDLYSNAVQGWHQFVSGLTAELGDLASVNAKIDQSNASRSQTAAVPARPEAEWHVGEIGHQRARIVLVGQSDDDTFLESVGRAAIEVPQRLQRGELVPYSSRVEEGARRFLGVVNGHIGSVAVRFGTEEVRFDRPLQRATARIDVALGAVEGLLLTLRGRKRLEFTLYDYLFEAAIRCSVKVELEEMVRAGWRRRVIVHGIVKRDAETGRPLHITDVTEIELVDDVEPGSYLMARGAGLLQDGEVSMIEDLIGARYG